MVIMWQMLGHWQEQKCNEKCLSRRRRIKYCGYAICELVNLLEKQINGNYYKLKDGIEKS